MSEEEHVLLLRTSFVAARATVERLLEQGIEADLDDVPNAIVRLTSGGTYRVSVLVPAASAERARAELARWEAESGPRLHSLAREVQRGLLLAALPGLGLAAWLVHRRSESFAAWMGSIGLLAAGVLVWAYLSRRRGPVGGG